MQIWTRPSQQWREHGLISFLHEDDKVQRKNSNKSETLVFKTSEKLAHLHEGKNRKAKR